ncbi:hypothetical protein Lpp228_00035 [Lacticaseibacillus paracasei subsp. paracasei Lpp228]|nr:hypothetical protein Lpp189_08685 [Lacticaseibacillus paracasei subsp. paracasei Lpp189]EPC68915.1 hypothetical protein Lpp228_00035 [Lacticaseibacillus paracasei subsp. paracasei Lpp228]
MTSNVVAIHQNKTFCYLIIGINGLKHTESMASQSTLYTVTNFSEST